MNTASSLNTRVVVTHQALQSMKTGGLLKASSSGGCGCKAPSDMLRSLLDGAALVDSQRDDAAIVDIHLPNGGKLVASIDAGGPLVGSGRDWGRITAAHAHSDTYAMGGVPHSTLAIVGMTHDDQVNAEITQALRSASKMCGYFGAPIVGGHTTIGKEPMLGLVSLGHVDQKNVKRKSDAKVGDAVILTKPIGIGLYAGALRGDGLSAKCYRELISVTTQVNFIGAQLGAIADVHAMTDVTGFGLLGHAIEIAEASNVSICLNMESIPLMQIARTLVVEGYASGISYATSASLMGKYSKTDTVSEDDIALLADPQTSGGLLLTCTANFAQTLVCTIKSAGFHSATIIGNVTDDHASLSIF